MSSPNLKMDFTSLIGLRFYNIRYIDLGYKYDKIKIIKKDACLTFKYQKK